MRRKGEFLWSLVPGTWSFSGHPKLDLCRAASTLPPNENQIRLLLAQREVVAAHLDFHGVAERRESNQFHWRPHQQAHFQQSPAVFGRYLDFGDSGGGTDRKGGQRLTGVCHRQAAFSSGRSGSTQIESASFALMPRRTLQT